VTVRARGWCRVDLAGGTLDIWPLGLLHEGARTINLAIDVPVTVEVTPADRGFTVLQGGERVTEESAEGLAANAATDLIGEILRELEAPPLVLKVESGSPRGGGLGASSALAVTLIAAVETLTERALSPPSRASALARDLEARLMCLPTGRQDHYPALLGGALEVLHAPGGEVVRHVRADLDALGGSLVVVYTGRSHFSAGKNWQVVRRRLDGDPESIELFAGVSAAAIDLLAALEAGELEEVGRQMSREWSFRRRFAEGVSTPEIERLLAAARDAGAWGGKATGAGGGGCMALLAPPARRGDVIAALEGAGGQVIAARPTEDALKVERF
jgi:D-glycero-alpha-D-manno-heptose-7-phosphate kinase